MLAARRRISSFKKRILWGALFCLALCVPPVLAATPSAEQLQGYEAADESARVRLLINLAKSGQHDMAEALLHRFPLQGPHAANRTLFIQGLISRARRDLKGAAELYRKALASDPGLSLVRAELAETLALMGEDDSAKHQLDRLMADAPTEEEANNIRAFIDRIDARRPFTYSAYISAAPSTNINNGSTNDTVYGSGSPIVIDGFTVSGGGIVPTDDSRAKSGIGVAAGGSMGFYHQLDSKFAFVFGAGIHGRIYDERRFDSLSLSQSAELRHAIEDGFLGAGLVASQALRTDELGFSYYGAGPRVSLFKQLTPQDRINASATYEWRKYKGNDASNGAALMIDGLWQHAFSSELGVGINAGYDRVTSGIDYQEYQAYSAGLSLYRELSHGVTVNLQGDYRLADFDAEMLLYNKERLDHQAAGSITLTKRDFNLFGYAPSLEYTYVRNFSNIPLYDFDSHTIDLTLTKDF
jgi:outer membrane protein